MDIEITRAALDEIEAKYDKLSNFLVSNYANFPACALILQTVMEKVDELKEKFREREENEDCE